MTTHQAFTELISKRLWYVNLGLTKLTANSIASRFRKGDGKLRIEKIEDLLLKAGFQVQQEKKWIR